MRAAFSYYIHRPSTAAAVSLRQHFRLAACGRRVSASLGWKEDPRPSNRSFFSPLFRAPFTFVQAHRGLCSSRSECSSMGGPLPAMAECSRADPPPQAAEAPKGQPWPSGGRHSFRHTTGDARRHPETSWKAWLGLLGGPVPGEQGAGGVLEVARRGRR